MTFAARSATLLGDDTIAAVATPIGRGALAVLRLSGPSTRTIAAALLDPWPIPPRTATLCRIGANRDPGSGDARVHSPVAGEAVIDRALATFFPAPDSYTGEDVLEVSVHGGAVVPALALSALLRAGARQAYPGEFTRRAVLNGKMDLLQAEAVADLVDARSVAMHHAAIRQLEGGLSRAIARLRDECLDLEALLAYDIDFPEEDEGPIDPKRIAGAVDVVLSAIDRLLATSDAGAMVREGAIVVLAGRPNTGKSSLFNALLGESRAIVTEVPGTTRDALEVPVELGGWPIRLVDTAGLRDTTERVERLGIEVAHRWLGDAHIVLLCSDDANTLEADRSQVAGLTTAPVLAIRTKADLDGGHAAPAVPSVSAVTREGLAGLVERLAGEVSARYGAIEPDVPLLTRERYRIALERARDELERFRRAWIARSIPATVAAVHVRAAISALEELIGAVDVEDVLDRLFSTFCVGK